MLTNDPYFPATFWTNPQYRINIPDGDDDDDEGSQKVIVGVMQKDRRKMRAQGERDLTIGYCVYEVKPLIWHSYHPARTLEVFSSTADISPANTECA